MELEELDKSADEWDVAKCAQAMKLLKQKMKDKATIVIPEHEIRDFIIRFVQSALRSEVFLNYPMDFENAVRNPRYKSIINEVMQMSQDLHDINLSSNSLQLAWKHCTASSTIMELKKNLKMYFSILNDGCYTDNDLKWYIDEINALETNAQCGKEIERQNNALFEVYEKDDEELAIMLKYRKLKREGLTDIETYTVLGITKDKLKALKKKFVFEE